MKAKFREAHISRLMNCEVNPEAGCMAMDLAINIEKMGDHLISIAKAVIKDLQWGNKIVADDEEIKEAL